jgi:penicillin-binding protein 1A
MRIEQPAQWQDIPAGQGPSGGPGSPFWHAPRRPWWKRMLGRGGGGGPVDPNAPPKPWYRRWKWKHVILGSLALFMLLIAWLAITAPLSKSLQPIAAPSLTLLSAEGEPIARRGADIREPVDLQKLPDHVPQAFIAIEDKRFHDHLGISIRGITRAMWRNMGAGGVREGGSTITQQLAKTSFLSSERTLGRKGQEALIALWLEAWLTKEEILERYLSNVYFGDNVYGLRAAANHYFSVEPEKLSIPQAAMLAGMVKAPSRLAPTKNYNQARQRGRLVIRAMIDQGYITPAEANKLRPARLKVEKVRNVPTGTYFADWVLPTAREQGEAGYGEQEIQTTLESRLQKHAVSIVRRAGLGRAQVALVAMRPDGRVVAMVGGKDYARSPFNRATQARRQPGSAFKLFVYLAALRAGLDPDTPIEDRPLRIGTWQPKNYQDRYRGTLTLRDAFAVSSNVAAVRLSERVGRENVIRAARDLGVRSPLADNPSLALGASGTTLLEMTAAYAAVAAGRFPLQPRGIEEGKRGFWGQMWEKSVGTSGDPSFDELRELLGAVVQQGTGRGAALAVPAFGKTGTSQDSRDALFIGFAEDLVVGVWIGNDDNSPLPGAMAGGGLPARIWRDFMAGALQTRPAAPKAPPIAAPAEVPMVDANASLTVPIEGTGYQLGVDVRDDGVSVSAQPTGEGGDGQPPRDIPIVDIPLPPPEVRPERPAGNQPQPKGGPAPKEKARPAPADGGGG